MKPSILFIHGAWLSASSWTPWIEFARQQGFDASAVAWPHLEGEATKLRANPPEGLKEVGVGELVEHYAKIVQSYEHAPVLIGHSFGGLITQQLLARGLGAAGVTLNSATPKGILPRPSAVRTAWPVLSARDSANKLHQISKKAFAARFANGLTPEQVDTHFQDHVVPAPGRTFDDAAKNKDPMVLDTTSARAPLLMIAGGKDLTVTGSMQKSNYKKYKNCPSRVEFRMFKDRCHYTQAEDGWEEVAKCAFDFINSVVA